MRTTTHLAAVIDRRLWQYATRAVLMDAQHSDWPSARALVEWRERRRRYITLYQRKLAVLKHCASSSNLQKQVAAPREDCACCNLSTLLSVSWRMHHTPEVVLSLLGDCRNANKASVISTPCA